MSFIFSSSSDSQVPEHRAKNDSEAALDFSRKEDCGWLALPATGAERRNYGICQQFDICYLNKLAHFVDGKMEVLRKEEVYCLTSYRVQIFTSNSA